MARYTRVTRKQANQISRYSDKFGENTLRRILTDKGDRIMSRKRLSRLESGTGKLSPEEQERLERIVKNSQKISGLQRRGEGKSERKVAIAIRDWLEFGKSKNTPAKHDDWAAWEEWEYAIDALEYLDVDVDDGDYYVESN